MNIAIATGTDIPQESADDDLPLLAELTRRGIGSEVVPWETDGGWDVFDVVLVRTTWDYMPRRKQFLDWAHQVNETTPVFNPPDLIAWNTDKHYLAQLQQYGAPLAPTVWVEQGGRLDVAATMRERAWARGFLKPVVGANASDTFRFDADRAGTAAAQAFLDARSTAVGFMLQPYLARIETQGEISAISIDGEISHVVRKLPQAGDYRVQDDLGGSDRRIEMDAEQATAVRRVVKAARGCAPTLERRPPLYARVDMQWDNDGELCLTELEMVEPSLFFRHNDDAARQLVDALLQRVLN